MAVLQKPLFTRSVPSARWHCEYIATEESLRRLERTLQAHSLIALDTESDSFHSYASKICLLQLAVETGYRNSDTERTLVFLVDPQAVDVGCLRPYFADAEKTVVVHAAANDLGQLWQEYGISIANLFDTQVAARLAGMTRTSLRRLLEDQFGVLQSKKAQTSDWGRRPLSEAQLRYARQDVTHLIPLYRMLGNALHATRKLHEGLAVMEEIAGRDYSRFGSPTKTFWDYPATKRVPIELIHVYHGLWDWREKRARSANVPRHRIIGDRPLLLLTREQPADLKQLFSDVGLTAAQVALYGKELLSVLESARQEFPHAAPSLPSKPKSRETPHRRNLMQRLRRWRQETSRSRGVDSDFILGQHVLQVIVDAAPSSLEDLARSNALGDWKLREYGEDVVRIVRGSAAT